MEATVKGSTVIDVGEDILSVKTVEGVCSIHIAIALRAAVLVASCGIVIADVCLLTCTGVFLNPLTIVATCMVKVVNKKGEEGEEEKKFSFDKEMLADLVCPRAPYRGVLHAAVHSISLPSLLCVIGTDRGICIAVSVAGRPPAGRRGRPARALPAHVQLGQSCQ